MTSTHGAERSPLPRWWLGALLGLGAVAAVAVSNVRSVVLARARARELARELDHRATVGSGLGEPLHLVVLGDSSAAGYGLSDAADALPQQVATRLAATAGRRVRITSLARDGARTRDVLLEQAVHLRRLDPDVVVVLVGVNDALARATPRDVAADTMRLADALVRGAPDAAIAYVTCPNLRYAPALPRPLHLVMGASCRRVARAQQRALAGGQVTAVDLYGRLDPDDFAPDGFHPGTTGSAQVAQRVVAALTQEDATWTSD